ARREERSSIPLPRSAWRATTSPTWCSPICTSTTSAGRPTRKAARRSRRRRTGARRPTGTTSWSTSSGSTRSGSASRRISCSRGRFETGDGDGPLLPGIDVRGAPGHTPGSSLVVVSSGTDRALLIGDVVHCPIQLLEDEWGVLYDVAPDLARRTRLALNRELE